MKKKSAKRWVQLAVLAAGGGIIFQLPYLRYAFYTQLQQALNINHEQYGSLLSVYAIVAMLSYFPGGWIADRVSARKLLTFSLLATGLSGFYFATFPSYGVNMALNAFWGLSTILTYWAALLKVTRTLGDKNEQGRMFGLLEGGRGLASAIGAYALLAVYTKLGEGIYGMAWVIRVFAVMHLIVGVLTWFVIEDPKTIEKTNPVMSDIVKVLKMPRVWLLCGVIFTTYSVYAGMTFTQPYLQTVFGASLGLASIIGMFQRYIMQLIGGVFGGVIADKIGSRTKVLFACYITLLISLGLFLIVPGSKSLMAVCLINLLLLAVTVFIMRGLYFSIIDELRVPLNITGAVIGFASLIGYLPDTFIYKLIGGWLDMYPGALGYRYMFTLMLGIAAVGTIVMYGVKRVIHKYDTESSRETHLRVGVDANSEIEAEICMEAENS